MPTRTCRVLLFALAWGATFFGLVGCVDYEDCWMDARSLHATGIPVTDKASAQEAFDAYVSFLAAHPDSFEHNVTGLTYISSSLDRKFEDLRYWRICYVETRSGGAAYVRCTIRIDQTGRVVYPLGCI